MQGTSRGEGVRTPAGGSVRFPHDFAGSLGPGELGLNLQSGEHSSAFRRRGLSVGCCGVRATARHSRVTCGFHAGRCRGDELPPRAPPWTREWRGSNSQVRTLARGPCFQKGSLSPLPQTLSVYAGPTLRGDKPRTGPCPRDGCCLRPLLIREDDSFSSRSRFSAPVATPSCYQQVTVLTASPSPSCRRACGGRARWLLCSARGSSRKERGLWRQRSGDPRAPGAPHPSALHTPSLSPSPRRTDSSVSSCRKVQTDHPVPRAPGAAGAWVVSPHLVSLRVQATSR